MTKVLFTSDIHGNMVQYGKLCSYAKKISADAIILAGDLAPKGLNPRRYVSGQRRFFEWEFRNFLISVKSELPKSKVYAIMGNEDCNANIDVLYKMDGDLLHMVHKKRLPIDDNYDIVGYSNVPIMLYSMKDWEKFDLTQKENDFGEDYCMRKLFDYSLRGFQSTGYGLEPFEFGEDDEKSDTIEKDLESEIFTKDPKKTLYVFHAPPNDTCLDMTGDEKHEGSYAIRGFIEKHQPYLTLHGHIHDTVKISKSFTQYIGETLSMSSGNHNVGDTLEAVVFTLEKPKEAKLVTIMQS